MHMGGSFSKQFSLLGEFCEGSLYCGFIPFVTLLCKLGRVICSLSGLGERVDIGGRRRGEFGRICDNSSWYGELRGNGRP